jgi:hypothetical protein
MKGFKNGCQVNNFIGDQFAVRFHSPAPLSQINDTRQSSSHRHRERALFASLFGHFRTRANSSTWRFSVQVLLGGAVSLLGLCLPATLHAQAAGHTVVFRQPGFPTLESEPVSEQVLKSALGAGTEFADINNLRSGNALKDARLLVLPNGSAMPAEAWPAIEAYLQRGGNLLLLGGRPLRVPVLGDAPGSFKQEAAQDSYSRELDFRNSYAVPMGPEETHFAWRAGYSFLPQIAVHAKKVFAEEGRLDGLGYLESADGTRVAAPVIVADDPGGKLPDTRVVALPFDPAPGYWNSQDGIRLIGAAARYAAAGPTHFFIEVQYSALRPGEIPQITLHLRRPSEVSEDKRVSEDKSPETSEAKVAMYLGDKHEAAVDLNGASADAPVPFSKPLAAGVYTIRATWTPAGASEPQEFAENGLEVEELSALETGPALGTHGDFLSLGGKPFFPVGTNYFTTQNNGWDFSGPRNAAVWERDFADMQRHGVSFVRTGVWMSNGKFVEPATGGVNERFLRNLEAYLAAAHHHGITVNFTCFAFSPRVGEPQRRPDQPGAPMPPPPNPYLNPAAVAAEHAYVLSIVHRFGKVPWLSYDLINEPSFSNPRVIFHGNVPNGDPVELHDWQTWLQQRYGNLSALADAWRVTPQSLGGWSSIPLPEMHDMTYDRYGNPNEVRAFDYNLFAQAMFSGWVHGMVEAIRGAGSTQLINVGQDEGGVTDRVLNQFYATAGVSFTTDHTYWQDDALLWDSVAAKRPGLPNITGETGYQPAWNPDGSWRYDELTGTDIMERKWALGFADGSSGAMQWDWAREPDFGMERSDGSAKVWENMMRGMGEFAKQAAPYATGLTPPQVAIVLPQSLQLSVLNPEALQAQKTAVRVLYQYDRAEAYAVGSYQTDVLGTPKLILLPSAYGLNAKAWSDIEARVKAGAVLLISGPFSEDAHLHETDRAKQLGLDTKIVPLQLRDDTLHFPGGDEPLEYPGMETTILDRAALPGGKDWAEVSLGAGKVLFSAYPLELNTNLQSVGAVYAYALKLAQVEPVYTTPVKNPGILICPTVLPHATLYVLTSETATGSVAFTDMRSGKTFSGILQAGRAALLLVGENGTLQAVYNWNGDK